MPAARYDNADTTATRIGDLLESAEMSTGECSSGNVRLESVSAGWLIGSSRGAVRAVVDVDGSDDMYG